MIRALIVIALFAAVVLAATPSAQAGVAISLGAGYSQVAWGWHHHSHVYYQPAPPTYYYYGPPAVRCTPPVVYVQPPAYYYRVPAHRHHR